MSAERKVEGDRWTNLSTSEAVADAVRRLEEIGNTPSEIVARKRFLDLLDLKPGHRVLDVGAGTGIVTLDVARRVAPDGEVVALDPSDKLLEFAERDATIAGMRDVVRVQVGDARALPFPDGSFDHALCHWVLLHVEPQLQVVQEMARVVRPDGRVMCVEVDWETAIVHPGERNLTRRILQANTDRQVDGWMGRRLIPLLREAGLRNVKAEPIVAVECNNESRGWHWFLASRAEGAVEAGGVTTQEAEQWYRTIEEAAKVGRYFFSVTQFAVMGEV